MFEGGAYLVALRASDPAVRDAMVDLAFSGRTVMAALVGRVSEAGWEAGMLRTERALRDAADVRAVLVDPLTDGELRGLLTA